MMLYTLFKITLGFIAFGNSPANPQDIIKRLKSGGFVVYFRHHATNHHQKDVKPIDLKSCEKQRNLSQEGKTGSLKIGKALNKHGIRFDKVWSSPYCRCKETADLAFGKYNVVDFLHFAINSNKEERSEQSKKLIKLLGHPPQPGTNNAIVSHTANLKEATKIWPKPEGVAHVFKPTPKGYEYIGRIGPSQWD